MFSLAAMVNPSAGFRKPILTPFVGIAINRHLVS